MIVKAISVRQPWAWLILNAGKDVENRTWRPNVRGSVFLHASGNMTPKDYEHGRDFAATLGIKIPEPSELERGGIVGAFNLWSVAEPGEPVSRWHFPEQYAIRLNTPTPLRFRRMHGRLFFFDVVPTPTERRALREAGLL